MHETVAPRKFWSIFQKKTREADDIIEGKQQKHGKRQLKSTWLDLAAMKAHRDALPERVCFSFLFLKFMLDSSSV